MSQHCKEAEHLKNFRQESPAQGGTESSPTLYELIPSEEKETIKAHVHVEITVSQIGGCSVYMGL